MAHINVKPLERTQVYETGEQAITHVLVYKVWSARWDYGDAAFGRTIDERRKIDAAIKAGDRTAFCAFKRKGYWRVELKEGAQK